MTVTTYIGLGSNLGDSYSILKDAIFALNKLGKVRVSKLYCTPPMGPQDQPNYLNAVAELTTALEPLVLLDELQNIENHFGRVRQRRWGERTLDLDLLLYGEQKIHHDRLIVPNDGLFERDFVLVPLLDLNADFAIDGQKLALLACVQNSALKPTYGLDWAV